MARQTPEIQGSTGQRSTVSGRWANSAAADSPPPPGERPTDGGAPARDEEPAAELVRVQHSDPAAAARTICLNMLTAQARTRAELAGALAKKSIPDDAAATVLDRLEAVDLINDRAFAAAFVASRQRERGLARAELIRQLCAKGVDRVLAVAAASTVGEDMERETASRLVSRKLTTMRGLDKQTQTRRFVSLLARKGYSAGVCYAVVRDAISAAGELDDDVLADAFL